MPKKREKPRKRNVTDPRCMFLDSTCFGEVGAYEQPGTSFGQSFVTRAVVYEKHKGLINHRVARSTKPPGGFLP